MNSLSKTWNFVSTGMELYSFALSYSIRNAPFDIVDTIKNDLNNDTDNIFTNGTLLTLGSSIEVSVFQPNCKW